MISSIPTGTRLGPYEIVAPIGGGVVPTLPLKHPRQGQRRMGFQRHQNASIVFENLEAGATVEEIAEWFDVTPEEIKTVLEFAARSLDPTAI